RTFVRSNGSSRAAARRSAGRPLVQRHPRGCARGKMKVALLSESLADEEVLRVLVGAVLGAAPQFLGAGFRARGWPNVAQVLPAVIRHLHFNTDADALVVTCDSDDSV